MGERAGEHYGPRAGSLSEGGLGLVVEPAMAERWGDVLQIMSATPCTCQYWRMSSGDYGRSTLDQRVAALRQQIEQSPAPGVIGCVGGQPVGWCGFGVRQNMEQLVRSRTIPAVDDRSVWSIVCFLVRPGHRAGA